MDPLTRRRCLTRAIAMIAGLGSMHRGWGAALATEERAVSGFDSVLWEAMGELSIEQTSRERMSIEAEPAVLSKIIAEVRQRRLHIRFAAGPMQTQQPIRFRLELKTLTSLETRGSGVVRISPLSATGLMLRLAGSDELRMARLEARSLECRLEGSGEVTIDGGRVDHQHVVIAGSGSYWAAKVASRLAEVAIDGSGEVRLAVSDRLDAKIVGSGDVLYAGNPRVVQTVTGAGEVRRMGD